MYVCGGECVSTVYDTALQCNTVQLAVNGEVLS